MAGQEERIRAYFEYRCKPEGYTLAQIFRDPATSASIPMALRPYGRKLCEAVGEGDCVIVPRLDRGFRDTIDGLSTVRDWQAKGAKVFILDAGGIDLSSDIGELVLGIMLNVAKWERRLIRGRLEEGKARIMAADPDFGYVGNMIRWGHKVIRRKKGLGKWMQVPDINLPERQWARWFLELRKRSMNFRQIALYCLKYRISPRTSKNKPMSISANNIFNALERELRVRLKEARIATTKGEPVPTYPTDYHPGGPQDLPGSVKELILHGRFTYESNRREAGESKMNAMFGPLEVLPPEKPE